MDVVGPLGRAALRAGKMNSEEVVEDHVSCIEFCFGIAGLSMT